MTGVYAAEGYQQITSLAAATALTVPSGADWCVVAVEGGTVRWRDDGTNPTTTVGMPLYAGDTMRFEGALAAVKFIQASGTVILNVSYYT